MVERLKFFRNFARISMSTRKISKFDSLKQVDQITEKLPTEQDSGFGYTSYFIPLIPFETTFLQSCGM